MMSVLSQMASPATVKPAGDAALITNLLFFLIFAIPAVAFVLSVFILKKSKAARLLSTLFVILTWVLTLAFLFLSDAPSLAFLPILPGAVALFYLWFDARTARLFGSHAEIRANPSFLGKKFSNLPGKVQLLLLLNLVPAALLALFLVVFFILLSAGGLLSKNLLLFAVLLFLLALWLILPYLIWKRNKIGWYLGIFGAFLDLFGFPIGTILGAVLLYLFFHPEVKAYFGYEARK